MQPIVNMLDDDQATDIGNMHKKLVTNRACGSGDILADGQTDTQTYSSVITILHNRSRGRSNNDRGYWHRTRAASIKEACRDSGGGSRKNESRPLCISTIGWATEGSFSPVPLTPKFLTQNKWRRKNPGLRGKQLLEWRTGCR